MKTLYSPLKYLHFQDRIQAWKEGRLVAPVHIRIKPTNRCNHRCWYCAYRSKNLHLGQDMNERDSIPPDKMKEVVDDIVAMGVRAVTFSGGGEPLLYKSLPETIERLASGGVRVATLTNGSNLKGRVADALAVHASWVRVSVDAWDEESYFASRGAKPGEFKQLIQNMKSFSDKRTRCVLGVSFIVNKQNFDHVPDACAQFRDAGASHVKLSAIVVGNTLEENNLYFRSFAKDAAPYIADALRLTCNNFEVLDHFHEIVDRFEKPYQSCPFLQFLTIIGADLNVYTCQDKAYTPEGLLGSIKDKSFRNFWFSDENYKQVRSIDPSVLCHHHCVSHRKNLSLIEYLDLDDEHKVFV
ncbi:MAG: radical SAM protein [Desulfomonilaceae bacterium]